MADSLCVLEDPDQLHCPAGVDDDTELQLPSDGERLEQQQVKQVQHCELEVGGGGGGGVCVCVCV